MAITPLRTNFKDDILDKSMDRKRQYNLIQNSNGTTSIEDVSLYLQMGDEYGENQINELNRTVNEVILELEKTQSNVEESAEKDFILINQQALIFSGDTCIIEDSRITADSLADVYFTTDTIITAEDADIYAETHDGYVSLIAGREPSGIIKATIRIKVV